MNPALHGDCTYTTKAEIDKAFHLLEGIIKGINSDNIINTYETTELSNWVETYLECIGKHPFSEVIPFVKKILADNVITESEMEDLRWLIDQLISDEKYRNILMADIQRLEGMMHGILADNEISDAEISYLKNWLDGNRQLTGIYPFDELQSVLCDIIGDGMITEKERNYLKVFMSQFIDQRTTATINFDAIDALKKEICISGICAVNPHIIFKDKLFCFTGVSANGSPEEITHVIQSKNGDYRDEVGDTTDFLIVGNNGNPCWAFSCYGRKVEQAISLRKSHKKITIINEIDFWKAASTF